MGDKELAQHHHSGPDMTFLYNSNNNNSLLYPQKKKYNIQIT